MAPKAVGYARTASAHQSVAPQLEALKAAGCSEVYTDQGVSGLVIDRPGIRQALDSLQPGDSLKVVSSDRLARSLSAVSMFRHDLIERGIRLETLNVADPAASLDTTLSDAMTFASQTAQSSAEESALWRKLAYRIGSALIRFARS